MKTAPGTILIAHRHMNVEIGAEAALFPEKEYISGIFFAVSQLDSTPQLCTCGAPSILTSYFYHHDGMYTRVLPLLLCVLCDSPSLPASISEHTNTKQSTFASSSYKEARSLWLHESAEKYFYPQREPSPPPKDNRIFEKNCNFCAVD
jgi:hypothetical protein